MAPPHQSLARHFLIISSSLCVLAAPTLPSFSVSVITESLIAQPRVLASASTRNAAVASPSSTSEALLASELAAGSLTWFATTETIVAIPRPSSAYSSVDSHYSDPNIASSSTGKGDGAFNKDAISASDSSRMPVSLTADALTNSLASISRTTLYVPPSATAGTYVQDAIPSRTSSATSSSLNASGTSAVIASASPKPATTDISDPNPPAEDQATSNAASQQSRRSAVLAAFLAIGTLTFLTVTMVCMRCKVPARLKRAKRDERRVRFDLPGVEQGQNVQSILQEKDEKNSLIPGPPSSQEVTLPVLSQQSRGGPYMHPSNPSSDWRVFASNNDDQFEDVTHILSTNVFAPLDRHGGSKSPGADSALSDASKTSSEDMHAASRASGGSASLTGVSYKSCESRYSTPSIARTSRDGPPGSGSAESMSPSLSFCRSPSPPASDSVPTPDLADPSAAGSTSTFSAIGLVGSKEPHVLTRGVRTSDDVELGSEWDVARAYGAHSSLGKDSLLSVIVEHMEPVEVGGRKCVLVQG